MTPIMLTGLELWEKKLLSMCNVPSTWDLISNKDPYWGVYKNYEPGKLRTKYEPEIFYNLFPWFVFCQLLIKIIKYQPSMYSTLGFRKYFVKPAYNTKITKI